MGRLLRGVAGALILSAAPAAAKSYTLPDAEVDVRVAPDGSLQVRELITFDYAGSFSGAYRDMRRRWTPEAATEAARWAAFRRYLRDFPRLQEAPPASVALWERLLVYGIAFGLAERVLEAAQIVAPEVVRQGSGLYSPSLYGNGHGSFYSGPSMNSLSSGFSSALAAPSSGSGGGGGGFSGGGGGGGGAW